MNLSARQGTIRSEPERKVVLMNVPYMVRSDIVRYHDVCGYHVDFAADEAQIKTTALTLAG